MIQLTLLLNYFNLEKIRSTQETNSLNFQRPFVYAPDNSFETFKILQKIPSRSTNALEFINFLEFIYMEHFLKALHFDKWLGSVFSKRRNSRCKCLKPSIFFRLTHYHYLYSIKTLANPKGKWDLPLEFPIFLIED